MAELLPFREAYGKGLVQLESGVVVVFSALLENGVDTVSSDLPENGAVDTMSAGSVDYHTISHLNSVVAVRRVALRPSRRRLMIGLSIVVKLGIVALNMQTSHGTSLGRLRIAIPIAADMVSVAEPGRSGLLGAQTPARVGKAVPTVIRTVIVERRSARLATRL